MLLRVPCRAVRVRVRASAADAEGGRRQQQAPATSPLRRREVLSLAALCTAPLPAHAAAPLAPLSLACGATLLAPSTWVRASDRANSGRGALTLALIGDFSAAVDTVSLRREPLPDGAEIWLTSGTLAADDVAQRLTAPERAAVVAGKATGGVAGVPSGESGVLSYDVLGATQRGRYYTVESRSEACRGNIQEASGGVLLCYGPRGDELPTITRHALTVYYALPPCLYVLKASCAESRWPLLQATLCDVAASFNADGIRNPDGA